ncbi:MAG: hybrid sensor histidine kinase/response regulator [Campylobacterota bacterium]|nr:hybrid sensor histidine kinase/response regulator [Campylobacterota bacterium]
MKNNLKELLKTTKDLNILYVEDEVQIRDEISDILKTFFKSVIVAYDGEDGLNKFTQYNKTKENIDLVITDINMPKVNGIELIQNIRKINNEISILVISAHNDTSYFLDTIKLGIDGYILKPLESDQLFISIQKVAEKINLRKENEDYKQNLEQKVIEEIQKREYQEKIFIQQSKLAAMGEMMDSVAHQWKQPLNIIAMRVDMLQYDFENNNIDKEYIDIFIQKFRLQLNHIVNTLDEFRTFFRPNKNNKEFYIHEIIDSTLLLTKDEFIKNNIEFIKDIQDEVSLFGNENDFKHLILNIINNAKDAFNQNNITNKTITINLSKDDKSIRLEIYDNAGGVPLDIIDDIFNANITTKEAIKGTGIGLYMSQQIANKHGGKLYVENIKDGAKFIFEVDG